MEGGRFPGKLGLLVEGRLRARRPCPPGGLGSEEDTERDDFRSELSSLEVDAEAVVQRLVDGHGRFAVADPAGAREDLDGDLAQTDDVVFCYNAFVLEAEDLVEFRGFAARVVGTARLLSRDGEGAVEAGEEGGEEEVGIFKSRCASEAKLRDEPVLEGAPEAFDAAFRLG